MRAAPTDRVFRRALLAALVLAGCSSDPGTTQPSVPPPPGPVAPGPLAGLLIVSDPGLAPALSPHDPAGAPDAATVAYVSLPPRSLPGAARVRIVNLRTGEFVTPPVLDGGFDPIAIHALVGDTLDVETASGGIGTATHTRVVTLRAAPPRVVRTSPPKGQTDVPLNLVIVIVLSEPIDPATLNPTTIRLRLGDQAVAGSLELDPEGTVVRLTPTGALSPGATYELEVTQALADRSGTPLDPPTTVSFTTADPAEVFPQFASVGAGHGFSCGLTTDGVVYCWGYTWDDWILGVCPDVSYDDSFPCGTPIFAPSPNRLYLTPVRLGGGLRFASLSVGWRHACGITTRGAAYCWGYAAYGQLGTGSAFLVGTLAPVAVAGGIRFTAISAGDSHTCGVAVDGAAYCWGFSMYGQLGNGASPACPVVCPSPQRVSGDLSFASVSAGNAVTCGLTTSGAPYCWGQNTYGDLGIGTPAGPEQCEGWYQHCSRTPVLVAGGHTFTSIAAMSMAACGLGTDEVTYCWGYGILGTIRTTDDCAPWDVGECSLTPRSIDAGQRFASLSATYQRACGTTAEGVAYCWGMDGSIAPTAFYDNTDWMRFSATTPVPVEGGLRFAMVSAGPTSHSCGVTPAGEWYCWGDNSAGQLGDGTRTSSATPVRVSLAIQP